MNNQVSDPEYWQRQADRAARLADSFHGQDVADTLRTLASEYQERAAVLTAALLQKMRRDRDDRPGPVRSEGW